MEQQVVDQKIAGGIVVISHGSKIASSPTVRWIVGRTNPMRPDTIFRLYSMKAKTITTARP